MSELQTIGVIGAGSWGTALAACIARAGRDVVLWARDEVLAAKIAKERCNEKYLPGVDLPAGITVVGAVEPFSACDAVLVVAPAQANRVTLELFAPVLKKNIPALLCSKGIEQNTNLFMSEVLKQVAPDLVPYVLSGPSFAADVVRGLPTAVTLAGPDVAGARRVSEAIGHKAFRIYASDDLTGVQIGGAVKNVLAIACGISDGMALGESCRAALITRAFSELTRFGSKLGAKPETLVGLSGLGDLNLTCSSMKSRNYALGYKIGQGDDPQSLMGQAGKVSEGAYTASVVVEIAARENVDMPICASVDAILKGRSDPQSELAKLLARPMRAETE